MKILDGKIAKEVIFSDLKKELSKLDRKLGFCVIQVGDDYSSNIYLRSKERMAKELNYNFNHIKFDENVSEEEILSTINDLNENDEIDGIMVQLPIPSHLDRKKIQNAISPFKDIDGLNDYNIGKLAHSNDSLVSCTAAGIVDLLKYYKIDVCGKNVTIIGRSDLVGKPLALLLTNMDATVTLCHSKTANLKQYTKMADILIVAVGNPKFISSDFIKDNSIVIDVGINQTASGLVGDVDFDDVKDKVCYITPTLGGVGQMTIAELGKNIYKAYMIRNN